LLYSSLISFLGLITKLTTAPLAAICVLLSLVRLLKKKTRLAFTKSALNIFVIGIGFLGVLYRNIIRAFTEENYDWLLGSSAHKLSGQLFVGNDLRHYLSFDLESFLSLPYTNPWLDEFGRKHFWSYLFKTSLFGEFSFEPAINKFIAFGLSYLLLAILIFALFGIISTIKSKNKASLVIFVYFLLHIISLIAYHYKVPTSSNNAFRYILPTLFAICYFSVKSFENNKWKKWLTFSLASVWAIGSISFFSAHLFNT
jgi:hypothetical protein